MRNAVVDVSALTDNPGSEENLEISIDVGSLELGSRKAEPVGPAHLTGSLEGVGTGVVLRGVLEAVLRLQCSRCLEEFDAAFQVGVEELFVKEELAPTVEAGEREFFPITEGKIDLTAPVTQAMLTELPLKPLCRPDCAGLCHVCGRNKNREPHECKEESIDVRMTKLADLKAALERDRRSQSG